MAKTLSNNLTNISGKTKRLVKRVLKCWKSSTVETSWGRNAVGKAKLCSLHFSVYAKLSLDDHANGGYALKRCQQTNWTQFEFHINQRALRMPLLFFHGAFTSKGRNSILQFWLPAFKRRIRYYSVYILNVLTWSAYKCHVLLVSFEYKRSYFISKRYKRTCLTSSLKRAEINRSTETSAKHSSGSKNIFSETIILIV